MAMADFGDVVAVSGSTAATKFNAFTIVCNVGSKVQYAVNHTFTKDIGDPANMNARFTNRFDDPTYYTA